MARVLKVFGSAEERKQLAAKHKLLADYDAFTIMEVGDQQAKGGARSHLVEDITQQANGTAPPSRKRGRPPGARNKPKRSRTPAEPTVTTS